MASPAPPPPTELTPLDKGIVAGLLIAEGSFGGDGRQPQVTLKMHVRHERLLRWLVERFPRTKLYGPYHHGDREFFQWMARGRALVQDVLPVLDEAAIADIDVHAAQRLATMRDRYADYIARVGRL
ncbi:MAG TPA: hypothetical protein VM266_17065 [Solirubrobacteraceae bacterium]|nr:hypothetical protein [Solirubrobacteraceae bacterium]